MPTRSRATLATIAWKVALANDRLQGGAGIDLVSYRDNATAVTVDLRGDGSAVLDTAKRGSETDTLTGIEGAIGGGGVDRFFGDAGDNWFQGGSGKDIFTGGAASTHTCSV